LKKLCKLLLAVFITAVTASAATKVVKHKIKSGDTLSSIANKYHTTIAKVRELNSMKKGAVIKIGKVLKVPTSVKTKRKIKIVKNTKKNTILRKVLKKHSKPLASKRVKRRRTVTVDDIFFKSAQPNIMAFNGFGFGSTKKGKKIINDAKNKLGRKYVWGATGKRDTYDCSGFTSYVYRKNGINIPRTSINQSKFGKFVTRSNLKKGDLIFFDTSKRRKGYVNHVGIYMGDGKFIHASSAKKKVVVSKLASFYANRYKGARRPL